MLILIAAPLLIGATTGRPFMGAATLSFLLVVRGVWALRHDRARHPHWMAAGIAIDLALVLTLQLQRQAIQEAASGNLTGWQLAHVGFSSLAAAGYLFLLPAGIAMVKNPDLRATTLKTWHRRIGFATLLARTLGFILMFSLLFKK